MCELRKIQFCSARICLKVTGYEQISLFISFIMCAFIRAWKDLKLRKSTSGRLWYFAFMFFKHFFLQNVQLFQGIPNLFTFLAYFSIYFILFQSVSIFLMFLIFISCFLTFSSKCSFYFKVLFHIFSSFFHFLLHVFKTFPSNNSPYNIRIHKELHKNLFHKTLLLHE